MSERGIDADDLCIGLGVHQARKAVARVAADALAVTRILLVESDPQRHMEGSKSLPCKVVAELLDARLVADGRKQILARRLRIGRILATVATHLVEVLGLRVV